MAASIDEFRLCKILNNLIELTQSKASYTECTNLIYRIWVRTPKWKRFITEPAVDMLMSSSWNRERFHSIVDRLRTARFSLLGPYLLLLYLAKFDPAPPHVVTNVPVAPNTNSQLGILNDEDIPEVYVKLNNATSDTTGVWGELAVSEKPPRGDIAPEDLSLVRPHLSIDFVDDYRFTPNYPMYIEGPAAQERQLIEDLLSCFLGFHGVYITADPLKTKYDRRTFTISEEIEPTFRGIVQRVLPLASSYSTIARFVEENRKIEAGRVNQALATMMDELLTDFTAVVAYIETRHKNRQMDLNAVWCDMRGSLDLMESLANLATAMMMTGARGAHTLSILHEAALGYIVNDNAHSTSINLLEMCAVPYFKSVSQWIYKGLLYDPYDEFMIVRNQSLDGTEDSPTYPDEYWNSGFRMRPDCVPSFLESVVDLIYDAGRYMDIVNRSLPLSVPCPLITEEELAYDLKDSKYLRSIERAHYFANRLLLRLMIEDYDVFGRLWCAKRYFVLEGGDLFVNIIEHCEQELERPVVDICPVYLSSLLMSALATTSSRADPYSGDIGFLLKKENLLMQVQRIADSEFKPQCIEVLSGLDAFTLTVMPEWPVNLVLNYKTITCFQMLFRLLFYNRRVERCLLRVKGKWNNGLRASALKHRMVCFLQGLHCYMADDTIEVQWSQFVKDTSKVYSLEYIMKCFSEFLQSSMSGCMLTDGLVAKSYRDVLEVCSDYGLHLSIRPDPDIDHFDTLFRNRVTVFLNNVDRLPFTKTGHCATAISLRVNYNNYYCTLLDETIPSTQNNSLQKQ